MTRKAAEAAATLLQDNFSAEAYETLQNYRKERLKSFEQTGVQALINAEKELIAFGEEVLQLLKEAENTNLNP